MSAKLSALERTYLTSMKSPVVCGPNLGALLGDIQETLPLFRLFLVGCSNGKESVDGGFVGIFCGDQGLKVMLSHDQTGRRCYVTKPNWGEALQSVDKGLREGTLDWRAHRPNKSPTRGKKSGG